MNGKLPEIFGDPEIVQVANPAVGALWHYTPPAGTIVRPLFVRCLLTCSGVAGNRYYRLEAEMPNGTIVQTAPSLVIQIANEAIRYNHSQGGFDPAPITTNYSLHLPPMMLTELDDLTGQVSGIDAGDQFSEIYIHLLKWRV